MKTFKEFVKEAIQPKKTVTYAPHDYYGSHEQKVLARKSASSSGGDGGE